MDGKVFGGKYRAIRELNAERAGRTWLAEGPDGTEVVVKVVHPADPPAAVRLEHDVSLLSGVRGPGLPRIVEWGHDLGEFFVVRPFVPGADLEVELEQQGAFAPATAAKYGGEAAAALGLIHARGLVHGNVRTSNLIRTPEDEIVLVGGGIGHADRSALEADMPPSSARYLAPEQVEGGAVTPATDVYALGVVLYEILSGRVPFDGPTVGSIADQQAHKPAEALSLSAPEVPAELRAVVMRALEKAPDARYVDGTEMASALERAMHPQPVQAPAGEPPSVPTSGSRGWMWAAIVLAIVVLAVLGAWVGGIIGKVSVPDVTRRTAAEASETLSAAGLKVGAVTYAGSQSSGLTDGDVSSQEPVAGTRVDRGSTVDLVLSGFEKVGVPGVVGQTEAHATAALQSAGLVTGTVANVATTSVAAGTVLTQDPAAGERVNKGSSVDLEVAVVPTATAVPGVVGMTRDGARSTLEAAGFVVTFTGRSSASVPNGTVIEQSPSAGVSATFGSTVAVVVSSGAGTVAVPSVVGKTQAAAVNALTAAGFKTQVTLQTGGGTVGTVIVQSPAAGVKATGGSTVTITVVQ